MASERTYIIKTTGKVTTEKTFTQEEIDKLASDVWINEVVSFTNRPHVASFIPFECNGTIYSLRYHPDYLEFYMYDFVRMVYGDDIAAEWLVNHSCARSSQLEEVEWYLKTLEDTKLLVSVETYEAFKREHGSIQRALEEQLITPETVTKLAEQIFTTAFQNNLTFLSLQHGERTSMLQEAIKARLHLAVDNLFPSSSEPTKRLRSE